MGVRTGRGDARRTHVVMAAVAAAAALGGCSVGVPDPAARSNPPLSSGPGTPTITPGHDAGAVAARDMPFSAGATLAHGVPVGLSEDLAEAPQWKQVVSNAGGASRYQKSDGCKVAAEVRQNQWPLVAADDRESTAALFAYLDPTVLPAYLKPASLRWGGERGKPGPAVDVLVLERAAKPTGQKADRATSVLARVFGTSGSSVYMSASCPTAAALAAARADIAQWLTVVPPG
ncbi:hypothetical protein [Arthrobacter globiformis]|uniref:hypothetical protein n=1 Tax=Arthrobacter globiformis TaxID=1665 RepID=UPI00278F407F|nr:hypothetical protein [Arthrobacter globiformis]MDQ0619586.1 hypothetical protein [Arthrobacter globiformis]